jgi:SAM-dependent methyltransferase
VLQEQGAGRHDWRVLEYGCGGGMNLIHVFKLLADRGIGIESAFGTDFAEPMIQAANNEVRSHLSPEEQKKIKFVLAPNENLSKNLAAEMAVPVSDLAGSFHLIFGINTFRYCHRIGASDQCANDIFSLLRPGGISIMIDMNNRFPFFRTRLRDKMTKPEEQCVLPSVSEYKSPFERAGFRILEVRNFCWIPHSAKGLELSICKMLNPLLDAIVPGFAMRTLVVGQKPKA